MAVPAAPKQLVKSLAARVVGTVLAGDPGVDAVALTFDDGPDPRSTPAVLEVLERRGARGTFFMVGENAARHPDLVRRVADAGHAVGNHTWDHPSLPLLGPGAARAQLEACRTALGPHDTGLFRPPYGDQSLATNLLAARLGYRVVTWNAIGEDWQDDDAATIAERVAGQLVPGAIVLLHDTLHTFERADYRDRSEVIGAVDLLLARFSDRFRFVTVPELLALGRPVVTTWFKRSPRSWLNGLHTPDGPARRYTSAGRAVLARI